MQYQNQHKNQIEMYRRRMAFSTRHVATLLGYRDTSTYRDWERGERIPSLMNAFRLGIILRVPLEFLFPESYDQLKGEIRAVEQRLEAPQQQPLF